MSITGFLARVVALIVAILLVVGALVWRARGDDAAPRPDDGSAAPTAPVDPGVVQCAAELGICDDLADAMDGLEVRSDPGVVTARALQAEEEVAVWVTLDALVAVAEDGRARASRGRAFTPDATVAATSPLVLVGWEDRLGALEGACGVSWDCIGQAAAGTWSEAGGQAAWGRPKPAWENPAASGVGLLVLAQATASRLDGDSVTARALDSDAVRPWLTDLVRAVPSFAPSSGSQLVEMVQFGRASRDVVGTTRAEAASVLARAGTRADGLVAAPASPPVTATAVVARPDGGELPDGLVLRVAELLAARGWDPVVDAPLGPALPSPVPEPTGTAPTWSGGALEAVLLRYEQVR